MPVKLSVSCQSSSLLMAGDSKNLIEVCGVKLAASEASFSFLLDSAGNQLLTSDGQKLTVRY